MSLAILDMPLKGTAAEQLHTAFDGQAPDALCETVISHPDSATPPLTLGVLGASHVAFVGRRENPPLTEEISRTASHGVPLSGAGVMVKARVENLSPGTFAQRADTLRREFGAGHPHSVAAEFPGSPDALTVLFAESIEQRYRRDTWHGYPSEWLVWTSNTWTAVADIHGAEADRVKGGS